jgi:hypothetical protein
MLYIINIKDAYIINADEICLVKSDMAYIIRESTFDCKMVRGDIPVHLRRDYYIGSGCRTGMFDLLVGYREPGNDGGWGGSQAGTPTLLSVKQQHNPCHSHKSADYRSAG